jgi:hypothetical protein
LLRELKETVPKTLSENMTVITQESYFSFSDRNHKPQRKSLEFEPVVIKKKKVIKWFRN